MPSKTFETVVGCLTSQQHASVSQGRICSDNFTCCHTEIEVADPTFHLTQPQCTDTGPTSPSADPITPGAWQGSHWSASFYVTGMTRPRKNPGASGYSNPGSSALEADASPLGQRGGLCSRQEAMLELLCGAIPLRELRRVQNLALWTRPPRWPSKASASRAEGPGFESRLRRDFFGVESYQ